ncbi:MAG: hypothetical protein Q9217_000109 [Psora testacea]
MKTLIITLLLALTSTIIYALPQGPPSNPGEFAPIGLERVRSSPAKPSSVASSIRDIPTTAHGPYKTGAARLPLGVGVASQIELDYNDAYYDRNSSGYYRVVEVTVEEGGQEHVRIFDVFELHNGNATRKHFYRPTGAVVPTGTVGMSSDMLVCTRAIAFPAQTGGPAQIKVPSPQAPGFKGPRRGR